MWRETTKHGRNQRIFEKEFQDWLPEKILDFHVHVMPEGTVPLGETYSCGGHPMTRYNLDDLSQDLAELYPGRETSAVCFGMPNVDYDQRLNDAYVAEHCDGKRFFPFRLLDPVNDEQVAFRRELKEGGFRGVKPYLNYVRKADPNEVEVHEMLPAWAMEVINDLGLIVVLHIPRRGRLADPLNQRQVVELCERYPNARIVLAHIGRAYYLENIVGHLDRLKDLPNLYFDLAMLNNWEVLEYLFNNVAVEKVLYGTDLPIAVAPGKSVEINGQYTYVTPVPWPLSISDDHGKLVFTAFAYEELRAIKKAVERCGHGDDFTSGLFYNHGMALLQENRS